MITGLIFVAIWAIVLASFMVSLWNEGGDQ